MQNVFVGVLERIKMLQQIHKEKNVKKNICKMNLDKHQESGEGEKMEMNEREWDPDEEESIIEVRLEAPVNY